jgi:V/A-type H+-transporting ATPase subunit C
MSELAKKAIIDFHLYPSVGEDDWQYAFAAAQVRALETQMLSRAALLDMANAENFELAIDLLAGSEYAVAHASKDFADVENMLLSRRSAIRELYKELIADKGLIEPFCAREDFANIRLALRRKLTGKPLGVDYSNDGSIAAEQFEEVFEEENYSPLPIYMQEAIERAVLAYYQNKDVRDIDHAIDALQAEYTLNKAAELKSEFLAGLFRLQIDLCNIRTMLRLRLTESEQRNVFLTGGYVEQGCLKHGLDISGDAIATLFFATPYYNLVESGVAYFEENKSFLKLERNCENYLMGYLKSTSQITAGSQPVIAYLLIKEHEIRAVRLILTAKKNRLDTKLILDRLGE